MFKEGQIIHFKKPYVMFTGIFGSGMVAIVRHDEIQVTMGEGTKGYCGKFFPVEELKELTREPKGNEPR
tara:strand:- start:110 stop:316 length:207 start_codon:yes stop_codon:yes gene_type:complete